MCPVARVALTTATGRKKVDGGKGRGWRSEPERVVQKREGELEQREEDDAKRG